MELEAQVKRLIEQNMSLNEELEYHKVHCDRLSNTIHEKHKELNQKSNELSNFLYALASHRCIISAAYKPYATWHYKVCFHPDIRQPKNSLNKFDENEARREFDHIHIEELSKLVENVGLDDWKVANCERGFHITKDFSSQSMPKLGEILSTIEGELQAKLNEAYKVKALKSIFEEGG